MTAISPKFEVLQDAIASFCQRWKVTNLPCLNLSYEMTFAQILIRLASA